MEKVEKAHMTLKTIHQLKENAQKTLEYFKFLELMKIPECMFYRYDDDACEEYCHNALIKRRKDFKAEQECWQCNRRIERTLRLVRRSEESGQGNSDRI